MISEIKFTQQGTETFQYKYTKVQMLVGAILQETANYEQINIGNTSDYTGNH